jgi:hypothetical protein
LPKTVKDALDIDAQTGYTFWRETIAREMRNVMPVFEFSDDDIVPKGCNLITWHVIFDVKFDLTHKARLVAGGKLVDAPKESGFTPVLFLAIAFALH